MKAIRTVGIYIWHAVICVSVFAVIVASCWFASYGVSVHRRHRAERLLQHFVALSTVPSDNSALQRFAKESGVTPKCVSDSCVYDFTEDFWFGTGWPSRLFRRTEWDYVGLRPWQAAVRFKVKNGVLTDSTFDFLVGRGRGWLYSESALSGNMWAWVGSSVRVNAGAFAQGVEFEKERLRLQTWAGRPGILIQKPTMDIGGGGQMLMVILSPDAPSETKGIAFDINLECATSFSPCAETCQLFPSAWRSYAQFQKSQGWYVDEPPICPSLSRPSGSPAQ
jgi:hypothetical protein